MRTPTPGARDRILDTASRLFYEHGVHAVGLQQIIDECGCGKAMLYREFASKDDLVVAWLQRCCADWWERVDETTAPVAGDPAAELIAIVRAAADSASCRGFRGCALRNTHAEFSDPRHPAHQVSVEHLSGVRAHLLRLAEQAHARDPETLADRVMLIIDGVNANGAVFGVDAAVAGAVAFAEDVVRAAVPNGPTCDYVPTGTSDNSRASGAKGSIVASETA